MISLETSAVERTCDVHFTIMMSDIGKGAGFRSHHQDFLTTCLKAKFLQRQDRI